MDQASAKQPITSSLGFVERLRSTRERQGLSQKDVAGIGKTGNRVIVDIENGKPTVQFQKILNLLDLLGLQLTVKAKGAQ